MRHILFALGIGLLLGTAGLAYADNQSDLQTKVDALTARVAELEGQQSQSWLNERRSEEVKALVREVLSDADTRASLLENTMSAGHDSRGFFLASEDGKFLLVTSGYTQIRYLWNHRFAAAGAAPDTFGGNGSNASNEHGFEITRMNLNFDGYISSPKIQYSVGLQVGRNSEAVALDHARVSYDLMEGLTIWAGEDKDCFLREEMTGDTYQLAVERSLINQLFTLGRIQGVGLIWKPTDMIIAQGTFNDGLRSGQATAGSGDFGGAFAKGWENTQTDFSVTGRVDVKLAGDWKQIRDFTSWAGEPLALFVGAAVHYETSKTGFNGAAGAPGGTGRNDKFLFWTVDASVESNGFDLYAAGVGAYFTGDDKAAGGELNADVYGAMIQGGYNIADKFEPFGRFEWLFLTPSQATAIGSPYKDLQFVTVGVNYYIAKHAAKFTLDAVWALEPVPAALGTFGNMQITGLLPSSTKGNEVVVRAQFQLMF